MIIKIGDVVGKCSSIVSFFGFGCSFSVHNSHKMNVRNIREVANEDCGANISLLGRYASMCWYKSVCGTNQVVNDDYLSWSGGLPNPE